MKIKTDDYLGIRFTDELRDHIYRMQKNIIDVRAVSVEENERITGELSGLLSQEGNKNYLLSRASVEIAKKIKVTEERFDGIMFRGLNVGRKATILVDDRFFYRYHILKDSISCIWVQVTPVGGNDNIGYVSLDYTNYRINTELGYLTYPEENPFEIEHFERFIQYLVFLEYSELETVTLKPQEKTKETKREGKVTNGSNSDVVIVDSTWNKTVFVDGTFSVRGHFRWQACGAKHGKRKLIFIEGFQKEGYTKHAQKERINNEH